MKKAHVSTSDIPSMRGKEDMPRECQHDGCDADGMYPAPRTREDLRNYIWFCLDHVREYNKKWNYFADMDDQQIEYFIKSDLTWHKTTKGFSSSENFFNILWNNALEDKLNIFKSSNFKDFKKTNLTTTDRDALDIMDLKYDAKWEEIQKKFKTLVKKYHPDKNLGSKKFEDKLKKITLAYSQLKLTIGKK
jgi:hypothetical protein